MASRHSSILITIPFLVAIIVAFPATTATLPTSSTAWSPAAAPEANSTTTPPPVEAPSPSPAAEPTAYDLLQQYNLPRGILPEGVTGYVLRPDGSFEVYLPSDCNLRAGKIDIRYSSVITGNVQNQTISGINGVHAKLVFFWIEITKVESDGSQLHFHAGPISKSFSVDTFANSLQCN